MSMKRPASSSTGPVAKARTIDATKAAKSDDDIEFDESSKTWAFVDMDGVIYGTPRPWMIQPWVRVVHPDVRFHGRIHYYYNEVTEESVWEDPTNPPGTHR